LHLFFEYALPLRVGRRLSSVGDDEKDGDDNDEETDAGTHCTADYHANVRLVAVCIVHTINQSINQCFIVQLARNVTEYSGKIQSSIK